MQHKIVIRSTGTLFVEAIDTLGHFKYQCLASKLPAHNVCL